MFNRCGEIIVFFWSYQYRNLTILRSPDCHGHIIASVRKSFCEQISETENGEQSHRTTINPPFRTDWCQNIALSECSTCYSWKSGSDPLLLPMPWEIRENLCVQRQSNHERQVFRNM